MLMKRTRGRSKDDCIHDKFTPYYSHSVFRGLGTEKQCNLIVQWLRVCTRQVYIYIRIIPPMNVRDQSFIIPPHHQNNSFPCFLLVSLFGACINPALYMSAYVLTCMFRTAKRASQGRLSTVENRFLMGIAWHAHRCAYVCVSWYEFVMLTQVKGCTHFHYACLPVRVCVLWELQKTCFPCL
jgi:hypothetical protein